MSGLLNAPTSKIIRISAVISMLTSAIVYTGTIIFNIVNTIPLWIWLPIFCISMFVGIYFAARNLFANKKSTRIKIAILLPLHNEDEIIQQDVELMLEDFGKADESHIL
jgi:hypothetical protein